MMNDEASRAMLMHLHGQVFALQNLFTTVMFASILGLSPSRKRFVIEELKSNLSSMREGPSSTLSDPSSSNDNKELAKGQMFVVERYSETVSKWEKELMDNEEMTAAENPPPRFPEGTEIPPQ